MEGFVKAVYNKLFGSLDSSLSDKMARGQQNYKDTVSKAELMAAKLRKIEEEKDKTAENNYRKTAKDILGHESYEFKAVGRNHVSMIDRDNDDAVELLKAPEGVYEAHFIALLLAEVSKGRYLTLCLCLTLNSG